jgi:hypothetical protein
VNLTGDSVFSRLFQLKFQNNRFKMMEDTGEDILRQKPGFVSSLFKRLGQVKKAQQLL